ncbi:nitrous oxide reductase accessory protein NosL [Leptospira meyeri]|uniref:nitrous oxide reductase accessory protein NosL n=1 Tax=Leptospira meyeri TaxID=29508 RepID=UPI000C2AFDE6|nr:nitrous oxide reductase accessory protein NosL [Leptospira meyeri]PKA24622.1 accessory protein NosL [Leptospira sp. mixed culture ATI2-C-A1]MCW7488776.1 nitrous oxide reductase accessory protein NosL [Leptospira meyeri]PJZ81069.1 accessory protein NosL [Leptospira meyeri]PJZ96573.1 accessory protein NosL [Leptospira meyeri]PKA12971.1 accessory protein NosL [Leptospira meyeri]
MQLKSFKLICIFLTVALMGCGDVRPEPLTVGEVKCSHCSMSIVDMRFHTQLITYKGKRYHFDAIECMEQFQKQKDLKIEKIWVTNYLNTKEMIPKEEAIIIHSDKIRSPMGAGLAAFKTHEDSSQFQN